MQRLLLELQRQPRQGHRLRRSRRSRRLPLVPGVGRRVGPEQIQGRGRLLHEARGRHQGQAGAGASVGGLGQEWRRQEWRQRAARGSDRLGGSECRRDERGGSRGLLRRGDEGHLQGPEDRAAVQDAGGERAEQEEGRGLPPGVRGRHHPLQRGEGRRRLANRNGQGRACRGPVQARRHGAGVRPRERPRRGLPQARGSPRHAPPLRGGPGLRLVGLGQHLAGQCGLHTLRKSRQAQPALHGRLQQGVAAEREPGAGAGLLQRRGGGHGGLRVRPFLPKLHGA
mmetsp:Transcript_23176/g.49290  ORF Transcript_23176/g.49290 Transcript_23176/m.49290 type:complete len:283 (+) Transcript_23176:644-1492(+)